MTHDQQHLSRSHCPVDQLEWFVNGTLPAKERATIEAHMMECAACRVEVVAWTELCLALRGVSARTPEPQADLFTQVERQLDGLASPVPGRWLHALLPTC